MRMTGSPWYQCAHWYHPPHKCGGQGRVPHRNRFPLDKWLCKFQFAYHRTIPSGSGWERLQITLVTTWLSALPTNSDLYSCSVKPICTKYIIAIPRIYCKFYRILNKKVAKKIRRQCCRNTKNPARRLPDWVFENSGGISTFRLPGKRRQPQRRQRRGRAYPQPGTRWSARRRRWTRRSPGRNG